ncbi:hypothetical protein PRIPAC_97002, partial [Pristionchus pacificus]
APKGSMAKLRFRPIEPSCCCCKVSSFLKCTYVSIIVLSFCTLAWAGITFLFHSCSSSSTFEQLLCKAYYDNQKPHVFIVVQGEIDLKLFDIFTSISGVMAGVVILIALLKPNSCTVVFARIFVLVPMCLITIQNMHFVSGAYGVPLTEKNEQLGLVIVMLFLSLFVINFFNVVNLFFSFILLCRLPSSPAFHRIK